MTTLWWITILAIPVLIGVYVCHYYYIMMRAVKNLRGPKVYPFFGDIQLIKQRHDIIGYLDRCGKEFPKICRVWFGPKLAVNVTDFELIKQLLNAPQLLDKPNIFYKVMGFKYGLVEVGGDIWRLHRKIINPSFNLKILQSFLPIFTKKSEELVKTLLDKPKGEEFDIFDDTMYCSVTAVYETTMGSEGFDQKTTKWIISQLQAGLDIVSERMFNPWLLLEWVYKFTRHYKEEYKIRSALSSLADKLIESRKSHFRQLPRINDTNMSFLKPQIFIDQLISLTMNEKSGIQLQNVEIQDESYTMLTVGSETNALTVANVILLLAMHPVAQEKAICEVDDFLATNEVITTDNLNQLAYLDLVMKETLRLLPAVPLIARESGDNFDLGPTNLIPGIVVIVNIFSLHRNKEAWGADAEEFRPERFELDEFKNIHSHAYIPFSAGPRMCVGQRYAFIAMKVMLIYLLKAFKFTTRLTLEELTFAYTISMKVRNGHMVKVEKRG